MNMPDSTNKSRKNATRRDFLNQTARTTAALGVGMVTAGSWTKVLGANERIRLGVIGPGERGRSVLGHFQEDTEVEDVALCDIYDESLNKAQKQAGGQAKELAERREVLAK